MLGILQAGLHLSQIAEFLWIAAREVEINRKSSERN